MLKRWLATSIVSIALLLGGCSGDKKEQPNTITVGTVAGPETTLMEVAKKVAWQRYHLRVDIVPFSDYNAPNAALENGSIDANAFQHAPFLKSQIKARGYHLSIIGKTFLYPMAIYSKKITRLSQLPKGAKVAIPNDPSNEARALILLQQAGVLKLKKDIDTNATPIDILSNPKHLQFVELDAAELPRSLQDVTLAVINTNYAVPAGLSPKKDALFVEKTNSPYANVIVVRMQDLQRKALLELVKAYQSKPVREKAQQLFGDGAIAAW